jgi:hypothetical protein
MATTRHPSALASAQLQRIRQATTKDAGTVELNVEELEDRIAPARRPPSFPL